MSDFFSAGALATLTDIGAVTTSLKNYVFMRATAVNATLKGYFVDQNGCMVGDSVSFTITGTPQNFYELNSNAEISPHAVGFIGRLTGNDIVYFTYHNKDGGAAGSDTDIATPMADIVANTTRYPLLSQSDNFRLGRA